MYECTSLRRQIEIELEAIDSTVRGDQAFSCLGGKGKDKLTACE